MNQSNAQDAGSKAIKSTDLHDDLNNDEKEDTIRHRSDG